MNTRDPPQTAADRYLSSSLFHHPDLQLPRSRQPYEHLPFLQPRRNNSQEHRRHHTSSNSYSATGAIITSATTRTEGSANRQKRDSSLEALDLDDLSWEELRGRLPYLRRRPPQESQTGPAEESTFGQLPRRLLDERDSEVFEETLIRSDDLYSSGLGDEDFPILESSHTFSTPRPAAPLPTLQCNSHSTTITSHDPSFTNTVDAIEDLISSSPFRSMPSIRKRAAPQNSSDSTPKRPRISRDPASPLHLGSNWPTTSIDLCGDDEDEQVQAVRERQLAEQVATQQSSSKPNQSRLTDLQCNVCLEPPTDLTATVCGHTFCRSCLLDWIVSAERDPSRRPTCPTCRRPLARAETKMKKDIVPLVFMKRKSRG